MKDLKSYTLEELWEMLSEDLTDKEFDQISTRIDEILDESNSVEEAFYRTDLRFFEPQSLLDYAYDFYYYKNQNN